MNILIFSVVVHVSDKPDIITPNTKLHPYSHLQKPQLLPSSPVNQLPPKSVTPQQPFSLNQFVRHPPHLQDLMNNLASLLLTLFSPSLSPSNPAH